MPEQEIQPRFGLFPEKDVELSGVDPEAVSDEMAENPGLNLDAAIGNVAMRPVVTADEAEQELDRKMGDMEADAGTLQGIGQFALRNQAGGLMNFSTEAERDAYYEKNKDYWNAPAGYQTPAEQAQQATGQNVQAYGPENVGSDGLTDRQREAALLARQQNEATYRSLQWDIQAEVNRERQKAEEAQGKQRGAARSQLARIGALGTTSAGVQYMNDMNVRHQQVINQLVEAGMRAKERAAIAKSEGDLKLLEQEMDLVRQNRLDAEQAQKDYFENLKAVNELKKFERETAATTIASFAEAGLGFDDIPEGYFDSMDVSSGYKKGTSAALFAVSKKEAERQDITDAREAQAFATEQAQSLQSVLATVPAGEPVQIGDYTYYGTKGSGDLQVDADGFGKMLVVDQATGRAYMKDLGYVGREQDGWSLMFDGSGRPWRFNDRTGALIYAGNPSSDTDATGTNWEQIIPTGEVWDNFGNRNVNIGQCGAFVNDLTGIGVGDSLESKKSVIDPSIGTPENPIQIGDVVVTSEGGWTGHVAIVNGIVEDPDGSQRLILSEANRNGDGKVTHSRQIKADSAIVQGFGRGNLVSYLKTGTDSPSFVPATETKLVDGNLYEKQADGTWKLAISKEETQSDLVIGGTILRKNEQGGYDEIYSLPEEEQENWELKEMNGQWKRVNKSTGVAESLRDENGNIIESTAQTGEFDKEIFGAVQSLRKELTGTQEWKTYQERTRQYGNVIASVSNPEQSGKEFLAKARAGGFTNVKGTAAGDLALIFSFMKLLDPGSVVREGEFATAQTAAGVPDRVRNLYNQAIKGERLADTVRADFVNQAGAQYKQARAQVMPTVEWYRQEAKASGLDPTRVIPPHELEMPESYSFKAPNGKTYYFESKEALDAFKKEAERPEGEPSSTRRIERVTA